MSIKIQTVARIADSLQKAAEQKNLPVDDDFRMELNAYAAQPALQDLDESDHSFVLEVLGQRTLDTHRRLDAESVMKTIRGVCHPKDAFDLCYNAARAVLEESGRHAAAKQVTDKADELRKALRRGRR